MLLSCILVLFESIVEFLVLGLSLVTGIFVDFYACTCFGLLIGCWIDNVVHVCKSLDVLMLDPVACIGWS